MSGIISLKNGVDYNSSSKLFRHLDRLNEWDKKGEVYPVTASIDLTNACNHHCPLCIGVRPDNHSIPFEKLKGIVLQLKEDGAQAIGFAGGGDPSCYPKLAEAIRFVKDQGMDVGIYTNCYLLSDDAISAILDCCTYLRISLDAGSPGIFKLTHGMDEKAFNKVLENIKKIVRLRKELNKKITIGAGYLVGPHTKTGIYDAVKLYKELGMDYIRIRPFFDGTGVEQFNDEDIGIINDQVEKSLELKSADFSITYPEHRMDWMLKGNKDRPYKKCHGISFVAEITANQELYPCCHLSGNKRYLYGSLKENSFKEIWNSQKRKDAVDSIDFRDCPNPCVFNTNNKILWDLKQKVPHENFL